MYKKINISDISDDLGNYDLFFCSIGFEERSVIIPEKMIHNLNCKTIIFFIDDFYKENIFNKDKIFVKAKADLIECYPIKYNNPIETFEKMKEAVENNNELIHKKILIDISAFTHEHLLMIIKILEEKNIEVDFIYIPASSYSLNNDVEEEKWLTRGIRDIRTVIGYSGITLPTEKNHLIILMGFEFERIKKVIEIFEFEQITVLIGSFEESIDANLYKINKGFCDKLMNLYPEINCDEISLKNIEACKIKISEIFNKYKEYNTVIIPMNNKVSTLASGLFALEEDRVQLNYISASEYNLKSYSIPVNYAYFLGKQLIKKQKNF